MPGQTVTRALNRISLVGRLNAEAIPLLLGALRAAESSGFQDFMLDFSQCSHAYPNGAVPLAAVADECHAKGLEFDHVFMAGLEEGIFPSRKAERDRWPSGVWKTK